MKTKIIVSLILIFSITELSGQVFSKIPKNINQAIERLDKKLSVGIKERLTNTTSDSLLILYQGSDSEFDVMDVWFYKWTRRGAKKDARLGKYYKKKGLKIPIDMIEVVLRTYQRKLKIGKVNHNQILKPFQIRQQRRNKEDKVRFVTDSLRGIYIPKNLEDCFETLDKIYSDSIKIEITKLTEDEYSSGNHLFGIGIWMRNNWQLWGGSRLSKYFNQIGIYHPDDMSGIIMDSYHRYLRREEIRLKEQIKYYQDYWKKSKE
ncbi:MAG: DUF6794 domain-containing protein [Bacteroidota bacterium]